jgi:predicted metal-dependent phosphoesterase TrpH
MSEGLTVRLTGHISPQDKETNDYIWLPFDVPTGVAELQVAYAYTGEGSGEPYAPPGNLVDIGIFDAEGRLFPSESGFRGWSGTARHEFTIGAADATPGYIPGPISPGRWHIVLGAYKIMPEGTDYEVTVRMIQGESSTVSTPTTSAPRVLRRGPGWFCGDLHCHTHHSDAKGTLQNLLEAARDAHLDFLAVTEHNTISHLPELAAYSGNDVLLIPGQEVTTYKGHANVWGCDAWLDFRCRSPEDMAWVVEKAHRCGGLISINHPKEDGPNWELGQDLDMDCVEVWQAPWFVGNYESLAFWEQMLNAGRRVVAVGGSDCHVAASRKEQGVPFLAQPTTWVRADELSVEGILAGILAGHVYISSGPDGPHLRFRAEIGAKEAMMGDTLEVASGDAVTFYAEAQGGNGLWLRLASQAGEVKRWEVSGDDFAAEWSVAVTEDTWVRADLIYPLEPDEESEPSAVMAEALTNPIYLRAGQR